MVVLWNMSLIYVKSWKIPSGVVSFYIFPFCSAPSYVVYRKLVLAIKVFLFLYLILKSFLELLFFFAYCFHIELKENFKNNIFLTRSIENTLYLLKLKCLKCSYRVYGDSNQLSLTQFVDLSLYICGSLSLKRHWWNRRCVIEFLPFTLLYTSNCF